MEPGCGLGRASRRRVGPRRSVVGSGERAGEQPEERRGVDRRGGSGSSVPPRSDRRGFGRRRRRIEEAEIVAPARRRLGRIQDRAARSSSSGSTASASDVERLVDRTRRPRRPSRAILRRGTPRPRSSGRAGGYALGQAGPAVALGLAPAGQPARAASPTGRQARLRGVGERSGRSSRPLAGNGDLGARARAPAVAR